MHHTITVVSQRGRTAHVVGAVGVAAMMVPALLAFSAYSQTPTTAAALAGSDLLRQQALQQEIAAETAYLVGLYAIQGAPLPPGGREEIERQVSEYFMNGAVVTGVPSAGPAAEYFSNGAAVLEVPTSVMPNYSFAPVTPAFPPTAASGTDAGRPPPEAGVVVPTTVGSTTVQVPSEDAGSLAGSASTAAETEAATPEGTPASGSTAAPSTGAPAITSQPTAAPPSTPSAPQASTSPETSQPTSANPANEAVTHESSRVSGVMTKSLGVVVAAAVGVFLFGALLSVLGVWLIVLSRTSSHSR